MFARCIKRGRWKRINHFMRNSNLARAKPALKTLGVFILGTVIGGALVFNYCWGVMASLMGVDAQNGYRAVDASISAYDTTRILSHLRLGEDKEAIGEAERQLDVFIIKSASASKETRDVKVKGVVNTQLKLVKRYRKIYPSQTEFKSRVQEILADVPDLPEPRQNTPEEKLSVLGRLYQRNHR